MKTSMMLKNNILTLTLLVFVFFTFSQTSVFAKDEWIMVNSKNFKLIGNASDKDIRKVGTKLEQFREVFTKLFTRANFAPKVPTTVIVFKSSSSYKPFKPKRADGKIDEFVAGYFQSGEDVNYITVSTEGEDEDTFGTIFHEYVHAFLDINFGKSEVPPWFNEGLAEFYQTFKIEEDKKVTLGYPQGVHLELLQQTQFIPLETLFTIDNYSLHQNGNHSKSVFYAQSWALIHYLIQGTKTSQSENLGKFLDATMKNVPAEKAFQDVFQKSYKEMEKDLKKYVQQSSYLTRVITFNNKLVFENEMQSLPISESTANAYLGDLLFHTNRADDAEPYLQKSISVDPNSTMAYTSLGMVKIDQRKYDEAKTYLDKAISKDQANFLAYYKYAYLLSREGMDDSGYVSNFKPEIAARIRELIKKAITINPNFSESYQLIAFINLVNNEQLDEALSFLQKALTLQPGNQQYLMRIAEIYSRQNKLKEARELAEKLAKTTDEDDVKARSASLINQINQIEQINAYNAASRKQYEEDVKNRSNGQTSYVRRNQPTPKNLTPEEVAKMQEEEAMISINQALRKVETGEKQVIGRITKIACAGGKVTYTVKTEKETVTLFSKDFQNLALVSLAENSSNVQIGCNENLNSFNAVLTFKEPAKLGANGELIAIDFVSDNFRFVDITKSQGVSGVTKEIELSDQDSSNGSSSAQDAMNKAVNNALRKVQDGEKREQGFIEKIECSNREMIVFFKTSTQTLKLIANAPKIHLMTFTRDVQNMKFGCGLKELNVPTLLTYRPNSDAKSKNQGEVIALELLPKDFKLEN